MATWTNIPTDRIEPGKPIRAIDGLALRDNPIAIAEGAAGAPRVIAPALRSTNPEAQWILNTLAAGTAVAGTQYVVHRAYGDLGTITKIAGAAGPDVSGSVDARYYGTVLVPGTYRIDAYVTRTSGGGSGTTRIVLMRNGASLTASPYRTTGGNPETFTATLNRGDGIHFRLDHTGANDRARSLTLTSVLIRTTNAGKGMIV